MKWHTRQGQIKIIRQIQSYLKTYLRWKECGTKASFFKRSELDQHIFNLNLINTITNETKIAKKSGQLLRLFADILKYEYDEEPQVYIPQIRYTKTTNIKKKTVPQQAFVSNGRPTVSTDPNLLKQR